MKYKKTLPYKLKLTAAIGLPLLLGACQEKQEPEQHDIIIELDGGNVKDLDRTFEKYNIDEIKKLDHDKTVRYIYLTPVSNWGGFGSKNMQIFRKNALEPTLAASPKVRGRGDFKTAPGVMAAIPADSLWYVQNGWTFNKSR